MSFTNKTANYDLPQYIATDKPSYLVDANGAYQAIDTAMKANETAAATAQNTADTNTAAISTLNTQINGEDGLASDLTAVETLAGTTAGAVQTINQVIGSGTPTTTAQTLIGAINELNAEINLGEVSVVADGVKSNATLLNELHALIDVTKLNEKSLLVEIDAVGNKNFCVLGARTTANILIFFKVNATTSHVYNYIIHCDTSNSDYIFVEDGSITDQSSVVPASGYTFKIVY